MSPEESQLLKGLFDRTKTASATPRDREAETLIADAVRDQPAAPYYLAQAVIVQEKGLEAAAAHIRQLEDRIHVLESGNNTPQAAAQGEFLSSIFGTGQSQQPSPTPAPAAAPTSWRNDTAGQTAGPWGALAGQQQPGGPWSQQPTAVGRSGGGFLQGALGTAAGVAGGMLLANSLSGIFGSHMSSLGLGSPFGGGNAAGNAPVEETVVNNYYGDSANQQNNDDDDNIQQADYDDNADDADFDSGDDGSFA
ncbi:DUF2076 domain-containing protein [Agrobacterium tumefaciens]|uniref:DUF2076 domain-containing protein n=1 Tax=Agrobacterium tumefaciens TaxID=358 RepID=A0A546XZV0_AGRTU|nr:DUF2076 domain-containing protein [Agrobacterium tumefaciens]TRB06258.1 DUF2076 domain-containing protein [Agrobacterium tumefaciens]